MNPCIRGLLLGGVAGVVGPGWSCIGGVAGRAVGAWSWSPVGEDCTGSRPLSSAAAEGNVAMPCACLNCEGSTVLVAFGSIGGMNNFP
jgi:hypothetical protein